MKYSVVFPCYNESDNLPSLVKALNEFPQKYDVEFILVQNGSTDNSEQLIQSLITESDRISMVKVPVNKGYGYGIKQGVRVCNGEFICWMHSDMQLPPSVLVNFFDYIEVSKNDALFMKGRRRNRHLIEYFFTICMGLFESLLFHTFVYDVMSMPVIIRKDVLEDFDSAPNDFSIDIYSYILARRKKMQVVHLPVYMKDRVGGTSSWNTGLYSRLKQSVRMIKASIKIKL